MEKKTIAIVVLILISGLLIYRSIYLGNQLKTETDISNGIIEEIKQRNEARLSEIKKDSINGAKKIDSLNTFITTSNKEHEKEIYKYQSVISKIKKINYVSDFNAYNDSLLRYIQSTNGH